MKSSKLKKKKGFSILELSISIGIGSLVLAGVALTQQSNIKAVQKSKDIVFAQNKAIQIIEELRGIVRGGESSTDTLDIYDDKKTYPSVLTVERLQSSDPEVTAPSYTSSNVKGSHGNWKFVRHISVTKNSTDSKSRNINVSIYYGDKFGNASGTPLATLSTILSTSAAGNTPTQVMDTYGIAILNQPGWWAEMVGLKKNFKDAVYDLKVKNPGLDYRFHFISRSSFGRDPYYAPYINEALQTKDDTNIKFPYAYNGKIYDTQRSKETYYYNGPEMLFDGMRLGVDGNKPLKNTWYKDSISSQGNVNVYSAADQFNSSVRWPEELAINKKFQDYYISKNRASDYEPTYRKLLEDMLSSSDNYPKYRNIMINNLHGELFPAIPLRNYSDPAKDPTGVEVDKDWVTGNVLGNTNSIHKRVVTHPEQLKYSIDDSSAHKDRKIYLRVYPYLASPNSVETSADKINTMSVFIPTNDLVGSKSTETESKSYSSDTSGGDKLSNFTISPGDIQQIKDNLKINYIDNDWQRRGGNLKGWIKLTNSNLISGTTLPRTFNVGDIISYSPVISSVAGKTSKFKILAINGGLTSKELTNGTSEEFKVCSTSDDSTILSSGTIFNFAPTYKGKIKDETDTTDKANVNGSDFSISTSTINTDSLKGVFEGSYEVIVNPAFDRFGEGVKKYQPGILIKLYGSRTKHTQATSGSGLGGLPTDKKLFGMEYIPSPLGAGMGATTFPKQGTLNFTDKLDGVVAANKDIMGNGAYTGLNGRDLDSLGNKTKNTARWIISLNVGNSTTLSSTNILRNFQGSIIPIETRIGNDLNTGLSMNQSPNPYKGEINESTLKSNTSANNYDYEYVKVNNLTSSCEATNTDCGLIAPYASFKEANLNKNSLSNVSRTYVWLGSAYLPETEKYQMSGDPRHNPYIDVLENNWINYYFSRKNEAITTISYINSGADFYPNLDPTKYPENAFSSSKPTIDITRSFKLFRDAIVKTNSIYNSLIGFSFYYYSLGGEVGSNGNSVNFLAKGLPYNGVDAKIGESDSPSWNEVLNDKASTRIIASNDKKWVSLPWLGELYPDTKFGSTSSLDTDIKWANYGNLEAKIEGTVTDNYFSRQKYTESFKSISNDGTTSKQFSDRVFGNRLQGEGAKAFFHGSGDGVNTKSFRHYSTDGTSGALSNTGKDLVANYGLIMPDSIEVPRPFNFSGDNSNVPLWSFYNNEHNTLKMMGNNGTFINTFTGTTDKDSMFYKANDNDKAGSAPVMIDASVNNPTERNRGYVIINGLKSQGLEAGTIISRYSLMSMLHTYLRTGNTTENTSDSGVLKNRSVMTERTEILDSVNAKKLASYDSSTKYTPREASDVSSVKYPSGVPFYWKTNWRKWNNTKYSSDYSNAWKEKDINVIYNILISKDNGGTWTYLNNDGSISNTNAIAGEVNTTSSYVINTITGTDYTASETFNDNGTNVNIPSSIKNINIDISSFESGPIIVRVEGHRFDQYSGNNIELPNNYTYHQRVFNVKKEG